MQNYGYLEVNVALHENYMDGYVNATIQVLGAAGYMQRQYIMY